MDDERLKHIGAALKHRRQMLNLTQEDVAGIAEIERSYLSDIENGKRPLKMLVLLRIVDALKTTLADIATNARV